MSLGLRSGTVCNKELEEYCAVGSECVVELRTGECKCYKGWIQQDGSCGMYYYYVAGCNKTSDTLKNILLVYLPFVHI